MAEISLDNFLGTTEPAAQPEQQNNVISLDDFINVKPQYPSLSETNKKHRNKLFKKDPKKIHFIHYRNK